MSGFVILSIIVFNSVTMPLINFTKYHGTGNDFIILDNRNQTVQFNQEEIARLCHRRFGIGADGLMLLLSSEGYDFEMQYFNADGGEGSMCGNGGRCITAFAFHLGLIEEHATFLAIDGTHNALITKSSDDYCQIQVSLNDVKNVKTAGTNKYIMDTGSPHYVEFTKDIKSVDVFSEGKRIRLDKQFQPAGTNVNFVEEKGSGLKVVTFERGVEDITLSCGTGVTAAAIAASAEKSDGHYTWEIDTQGGNLSVSFIKQNNHYTDIWLSGPAEKTYSGTIKT